uniref:Ovule protein n=1 Tax=Ascaris lumbricoides TaxID=6252 RepID=A0A0M3HXW5_ASCLU
MCLHRSQRTNFIIVGFHYVTMLQRQKKKIEEYRHQTLLNKSFVDTLVSALPFIPHFQGLSDLFPSNGGLLAALFKDDDGLNVEPKERKPQTEVEKAAVEAIEQGNRVATKSKTTEMFSTS